MPHSPPGIHVNVSFREEHYNTTNILKNQEIEGGLCAPSSFMSSIFISGKYKFTLSI